MKNKLKTCIIILVSGVLFNFPTRAEESTADPVLAQLREDLNNSDKSPTQVNLIANQVKIAIDALQLQPDRNTWVTLKLTSALVTGLTVREDFTNSNPANESDPVIQCMTAMLVKLQSVIDIEWEWVDVPMNTLPPGNVPGISAGMSPDGIEDPDLRAQYIELREQNHMVSLNNKYQKNLRFYRKQILGSLKFLADSPQYPHWTKESVETRFGTSPELLAAIREYWQQEE